VMGMAALGSPVHVDRIREELLEITPPSFRLKLNPHHGIGDWMSDAKAEDLAASIQAVLEEVMVGAAVWARGRSDSRNLILGGGVALNCAANAKIARQAGFDDVWIFPNPGDAGSSVGAVAAVRGGRLRWEGPYLGTEIAGEYPVEALVKELASNGIAAVASGRAEFGPRALGNRSLLADPRPLDMKDRVNVVKGREPFRPFAPIVRAERAHELFDMPVKASPYMQFVAPCRFPDEYPSITHLDGTSRVQTVARDEHPDLYRLLEAWEAETGCPLLLNTSLNVKGEPLVNTRDDAVRFQAANGVRVY
jgi:carbamoyltransferase